MSRHEPGCIELHTTFWNIVRPVSLTLEIFPGDAQWNYLRLESAKLDPIEIYEELDGGDEQFGDADDQEEHSAEENQHRLAERASEELTEIDEETYASREVWDEGRYNGEELPEGARVVVRWFGGAFVIFQKTSFYNLAHGRLDAYNGRHNTMSAAEFRSHVAELRKGVEERGIDLRARRIAARDRVHDRTEQKERR